MPSFRELNWTVFKPVQLDRFFKYCLLSNFLNHNFKYRGEAYFPVYSMRKMIKLTKYSRWKPQHHRNLRGRLHHQQRLRCSTAVSSRGRLSRLRLRIKATHRIHSRLEGDVHGVYTAVSGSRVLWNSHNGDPLQRRRDGHTKYRRAPVVSLCVI